MNANPQTLDDGDQQLILDAIEKWIEQKVKPVTMQLEHDDEYPEELVEDMKELGLFGALIDPQWGGLGLSATTYARIVSCLLYTSPSPRDRQKSRMPSSA